jgi:hypothetical protein
LTILPSKRDFLILDRKIRTECSLPAALQDYRSLKPLLFDAEYRYQPRVVEQFLKSARRRFFRSFVEDLESASP